MFSSVYYYYYYFILFALFAFIMMVSTSTLGICDGFSTTLLQFV